MFSALKKLVGSEQAPGRDKNIPAGLQSMNQALQRRFAKGVQYNSECGRVRGFLPGGPGKWGPRAGPGDWAESGSRLAREALAALWRLGGVAAGGEIVADPVCVEDGLSPYLC